MRIHLIIIVVVGLLSTDACTAGAGVDPACRYTWSKKVRRDKLDDARHYCQTLVEDGHSDWRLPTISELRCLVKNCAVSESKGLCGIEDTCPGERCASAKNSIAPGPPCKCDCGGNYSVFGDREWLWSSTTFAGAYSATGTWARAINFKCGAVDGLDTGVLEAYVRCIRR